jgi:hypothetical protein
MAVIAFAGLVVVCGFFLYVLVQFRRDEKHPTRHEELPHRISDRGFPANRGPLLDPKKHRSGNAARQKDRLMPAEEQTLGIRMQPDPGAGKQDARINLERRTTPDKSACRK